jgi:molybdate transport system regulatory protein
MKSKQSNAPRFLPRLRIVCGEDIALGPGKVDLLALVSETGSIREAAERMHMSYMRAWTLIRTMNRCFKEPLVKAVRGGKQGGGARLTETGRAALALYQQIEKGALAAMEKDWASMTELLRI